MMPDRTPPWLDNAGYYESAFVFDLPPALHQRVLEWRRQLGVAVDLIGPHFTMCFLGRMTGAQLRLLSRTLSGLALPRSLPVALLGVGSFRRGRVIRNVHLRVRADAPLVRVHEQVLEAGHRFSWFSPGAHVGAGWTPHISIVDGAVFEQEPVLARAPDSVVLSSPHLIGQRLDAVRVPCCGALPPAGRPLRPAD